MRLSRYITALVLAIACWAAPTFGSEQAHQFIAGLEAYKAGDFQKAIDVFESLADSGVVNGQLYYDLGNAYLKSDRLGPALLWYERANRLIPGDPDLQFNLTYARSLTKDAVDESGPSLVRIFFFWKYQLSHRTVIVLAIVSSFLFWGIVAARLVTGRRRLARAAILAAIPALIFTLTAMFNFYEAAHTRHGVVLPEEIAVRSGLDKGTTQLFSLHAGARVTIVKALKDHYQIRFSADKIGWVAQDAVGVIE